MTDYKQLCTELLRAWDGAPTPSDFVDTNGYGTIQRIRAALAEPVPKAQSGDHPITPPPELVEQWMSEIWHEGTPVRVAASDLHIAAQAARWGADAELEACINYFHKYDTSWGEDSELIEGLRAARRPKPKSQAEEALEALDDAMIGGHIITTSTAAPTIRAALERLRELEGGND